MVGSLILDEWRNNKIGTYPLDTLFPSLVKAFIENVGHDRGRAMQAQTNLSTLKRHVEERLICWDQATMLELDSDVEPQDRLLACLVRKWHDVFCCSDSEISKEN